MADTLNTAVPFPTYGQGPWKLIEDASGIVDGTNTAAGSEPTPQFVQTLYKRPNYATSGTPNPNDGWTNNHPYMTGGWGWLNSSIPGHPLLLPMTTFGQTYGTMYMSRGVKMRANHFYKITMTRSDIINGAGTFRAILDGYHFYQHYRESSDGLITNLRDVSYTTPIQSADKTVILRLELYDRGSQWREMNIHEIQIDEYTMVGGSEPGDMLSLEATKDRLGYTHPNLHRRWIRDRTALPELPQIGSPSFDYEIGIYGLESVRYTNTMEVYDENNEDEIP